MEPTYILNHINKLCNQLIFEGYSICNDPSKDRVAVIVEPRRHPMLANIIRSTMYYVGDKWNLHVFTPLENISWLYTELGKSKFRVTPLNKNNMTSSEYSALLMSKEFWNMIPEENILIFQTDSVLFKKGIDMWIDHPSYGFDYVGANYYNKDHLAPNIGGIQGGLSLRKKSAMLTCIENIDKNEINKYRFDHGYKSFDLYNKITIPEDVYFTHACEILNMNIPTIEKRREFSIEADYHPNAIGHHGLKCPYLTAEQQKELLISNS